ncbi:MAG TPA: LPS assembly protein LptD [Blastocatellia bacterium]|nr:LPS assembly protein LptD [Blastocatellia bacterium]
MRYSYHFTQLPRILLSALLPILVASVVSVSSQAQQPAAPERKVEPPVHTGPGASPEEERKNLINMGWAVAPPKTIISPRPDGKPRRDVDIFSEEQYEQGNVTVAIGNVRVSDGEILIIADRITYNNATSDVLAEGNVFLEEQGQRLSGETLEFNYKTRRGVIRNATGFTNTTPDGVTVVVEAPRADKTGEDTYNLEDAMLTACQQKVPRWSFTAKRARIRLDHRAKVYNAFFRIRNIPVLWLPYASISISKKDRSSGFLTPSSGSSSIKGRTFHLAYFQTLGRSADVLIKTDVYSQRGIGLGFDFRARPDEHSHIAFGSSMVKDRLLGPKYYAGCDRATRGEECKLPDQGGSSFYVNAVQYLKNGFTAVADVNITSSFDFRNVFSDNVLNAISPEERSVFYLNKNWGANSFNAQVGQQSAFVANSIVKTRQLPSIEFSRRDSRISEKLPFYFSFDAALDGVQRVETTFNQVDLNTPRIVQRLDVSPRLTFPLKSVAGFTLTPSLGVRSTFYSDSVDPDQRQIVGQPLLRNYADLDLDLRAPALARVFRHGDGTPWFKHAIEPFVEYRRVKGIDDFNRTPLIDERDLIAETNEIEYGVTNRFFVKRKADDDSTPQTHELLNLTVSQKYFFDPTFGGALKPGQRNQFFPVNTLSGFSFLGAERDVSPLNLKARFYPVQNLFADLRLNYDTRYNSLRDIIVGMGASKGILSFSQSWYYTRRIEDDKLRDEQISFDPTTFPGNQFDFSALIGNRTRGPYGSFTLSYDFRNQTFDGAQRDSRFIYLTTTSGWAWDCCGFEVQHVTFNAGSRNESRFVFAFTLKGIGTFGTQSISPLYGPRR